MTMTKNELLDILMACRKAARSGRIEAAYAAESITDADRDLEEDLGRFDGHLDSALGHAKTAEAACRQVFDLLGRIPVSLDFTEEA